ncbi:MAG TPA: GerMN domain-containing protein [Candidatus Acidoferrales bacterium]|nr:GerMN domain-containing protein [Candidatus Acidoferrales bacterium]
MSRNLKITLGILGVAVIAGLISLRGLQKRVNQLAADQSVEERARREVVTPPITSPSDIAARALIYWASPAAPDQLAPVPVDLQLAADPSVRSKQVLRALILNAPSAQQRTLPADANLLALYVLPDGTAIADFSDALSSETPSGILSEALTVNSILRTLEANVPSLRRLKILIHGQEAETLAGHADLTGYFDLHSVAPATPPAAASAASSSQSASSSPTSSPAQTASPPTKP